MQISKRISNRAIGYIALVIILVIIYYVIPNAYDMKLRRTKINNMQYTEELRWSVDSINVNDKYIDVSGWILKPGTDSTNQNVEIIIKNSRTGKMYKGNTSTVIREDLNEVFQTEKSNYMNSGFAVTFRNKELGKKLEDWMIILKYSNNKMEYYVDTNTSLK